MADADDVLNYLKSNMNQNIIHVEPFYGDGTQDPISWLTAFDKASRVNNWRDEKLIRMLNGHLLDEAEEWWSNYYEANKDDNGAMTWENIATEYKEEYCTQRWINKWM